MTEPGEELVVPAQSPEMAEPRGADGVGDKTVFIVGCPRSGTTWVQLLLSEHPDVATAPETQIFAYYLSRFQRQWEHEHKGAGARLQGRAGLSRLLSQSEFDDLCRGVAESVLHRIRRDRPEARVVLEKSPMHALYGQWIHRLLPGARFIHVIRDPRDTVASLRAAGRTWARDWAPRNPIAGAFLWRKHVRAGREISSFEDAYLEVRYEDLRADTESALAQIQQWLGLEATPDEVARAVEACAFSRLSRNASSAKQPLPGEKSPSGFFRRGKPGGWREDLAPGHVRAIEHICAAEMGALGYQPALSTRPTTSGRIKAHRALHRLRGAIDWRFQKALDHI